MCVFFFFFLVFFLEGGKLNTNTGFFLRWIPIQTLPSGEDALHWGTVPGDASRFCQRWTGYRKFDRVKLHWKMMFSIYCMVQNAYCNIFKLVCKSHCRCGTMGLSTPSKGCLLTTLCAQWCQRFARIKDITIITISTIIIIITRPLPTWHMVDRQAFIQFECVHLGISSTSLCACGAQLVEWG